MVPVERQIYINNQTILNSNLNKNGLPSCILVVQYTYKPLVDVTTPAPGPGGSGGSEAKGATESDPSSNVPIGAIIGAAVGFFVFLAFALLALRLRNAYSA